MSMETPPIELPPPTAGRGRLSLSTAASYVALGTGVSRLTGVLRIVALAWALGQSHVADAFNLANTTPNMLYDIVLGGVLSATFIPVFVDQLVQSHQGGGVHLHFGRALGVDGRPRRDHRGRLVLAPAFITGLTALDTTSHSQLLHTIMAERADATTLLRWFVIQIAAYGFFALATALLNTQRRFVAVAWAPIVNNLVCIVVLVWFGLLTGRSATLASLADHHTPGRPARTGHLSRRGAPVRRADPQPARGGARSGPLALGPPRRRAAHRGPPQRLDLRLRPGQSGGPVRGHPPRRHRRGLRPGLLLHLRLRLLADALWDRRRHHHVGGGAGPGRALVHRPADRLLGPPVRRPARHVGAHHPGRGGPAPLGQTRRGPAARPRAQHGHRRRRPPARRWPCSPWAFRASAPISTSCASCSRCSAPRWPSTST